MMMFDNKMNTMDFHTATNDNIVVKSESMHSQVMNADSNNNTEQQRRSSDNSSSVEDTNNMFTKFAFPFKLHSILESSVESGQETIISWLPSGKAFKIHSPKEFADAVMPQYFNQTKYRSFQRQLYIYGFDRVKDKKSDEYGAYFHELFIRGASDLCLDMQRKKIKGTGLSNEERRKKASNLRSNSTPANKNSSRAQINKTYPTPNKATSMISDSQINSSQAEYANLGLSSLAAQLQQQMPGKLNPSGEWNRSSTAAVLKSALQVQEFATRQQNLNTIQNNINTIQNNAINCAITGRLPQYEKIVMMGGRRCSLGFVRSVNRRGSLLYDGDEVIFGDKKFHFTTQY